MKIKPLLIVIIATLAASKYSLGQSVVGGTQAVPATQNAPVVTQNASAVRFLAPQPGEKLQQNALTVRYAVDQPQVVAASTPTFRVRLDGREPIETTEKETTFTGLAVGNHTLAIEIVDANGTPVPGTHAETQFSVAPEPAPATDPGMAKPPAVRPPGDNSDKARPKRQPPQALAAEPKLILASLTSRGAYQDENLPDSGSTLPLLTAIGAGVLIGGLFSARKTRPARGR